MHAHALWDLGWVVPPPSGVAALLVQVNTLRQQVQQQQLLLESLQRRTGRVAPDPDFSKCDQTPASP